MSTGIEHYREAERCILQAVAYDERDEWQDALISIRVGEVHATLALAAMTPADVAQLAAKDLHPGEPS